MASTTSPTTAEFSGVGARRAKGIKPIPKLPASAFSPPNTGTGEKFPLPPSPTSIKPTEIVDAGVESSSALSDRATWQPRVTGVVLTLDSVQALTSIAQDPAIPILSASIPVADAADAATVTSVPISYSVPFTGSNPSLVLSVKSLLKSTPKTVIEVAVQNDLDTDEAWDALESFLGAVFEELPEDSESAIILSNILPPPLSLDVSTDKLFTHPSWRSYQSHTASLSFFTRVYIKFSPPARPIESAQAGEEGPGEWGKRVKMYLGQILEAFGNDRIIFGSLSSPSSAFSAFDWYELAREAIAEIVIEQEGVDAIFSVNAKRLYAVKA